MQLPEPAGDKAGWERTSAPETLSVAQASALLEPWLAGRSIEHVELMSGGLMNRNFHLRLRGRPADAVLRLYDRDPSACAKEVAVLGLIGRDLPVPRVLHVDDEPGHGPPLAVLSFVEGISLFALRSAGDDDASSEAVFDAGLTLAKLGHYPGPPTPRETVVGLVERFVAAPSFAARVSPALRDAVARTVAEWQPRLDELGRETSLVHGDFNSRNLFVNETEDGWRVSGILDWEFALDASPYVDVGNFLRYHRADRPRHEPRFSTGLRAGGMALPPDWLTIARIMDLPALCELLGRPSLPERIAAELVGLLNDTTEAHRK